MKKTVSERARYLRARKREHLTIRLLRAGLLIFCIGLWELAATLRWIDPFIFSSPSRALATLWRLAENGQLWEHLGMTLAETVIGFAAGFLLGLGIAVLLWWSRIAQKVCDPFLVVLNSLPKIALGPVVIVWVGAGMGAIITIALLISVVVSVLGILAGFLEVNEEKHLLMRTLGASKWQTFRYLVFPASLPNMIAVLKIGVGMSWVGVIVGEFLISRAGLGYLIVYGGQVFKMDLVMASVILLCAMAALMYALVAMLEKQVRKRWGE